MSYDFSESELEEIEAWKERGQIPSTFLWHVLNNDLIGAVAYADTVQENFLAQYVMAVNLRLPPICWGTPAKCEAHWRRFNKSEGEDDGSQD